MGASASAPCCRAADDKYDVSGADAINNVSDEKLQLGIQEPLSPSEAKLVQSTWRQALQLGPDKVGILLFKNIFKLAPEALQMFHFKAEPNVLTYETPKLKAHALRVVGTVGIAVEGLEDVPSLAPQLQELGLRHHGYGVRQPHYDIVGKALMMTLESAFREAFTPKSWASAAGLGVEAVGILLFRHIFRIAPEALQLFSFKDEADVYSSDRLKSHATKVVSTVDLAVSGLDKFEELVATLQSLGLRHSGYGVLPAHYDVVGQALIATLKDGLGKAFTAELESVWLKVWVIVSSTMMGSIYN